MLPRDTARTLLQQMLAAPCASIAAALNRVNLLRSPALAADGLGHRLLIDAAASAEPRLRRAARQALLRDYDPAPAYRAWVDGADGED